MLRELIDRIPFWWMEIICISILITIALGAAFFSPSFFSRSGDKKHIDRSNSVLAILSGGYSVLLAFIIITTWNSLLKAQDGAAQEANSIAIMMRNIAAFPEETKIKLTQAIRNYTVAVRVEEWKSMQKGQESPNADLGIVEMYKIMQSYEPKTKLEQLFYSQALINLNNIQKLRRDRINHINSVIPNQLSSAIILGSIILALLLGMVRGHAEFIDLVPIAIFAAVLGFNLAIALTLDFPFSGDIAVKNTFFYHGILSSFKD